jgi:hypothetical protein
MSAAANDSQTFACGGASAANTPTATRKETAFRMPSVYPCRSIARLVAADDDGA